MIPANSEDLVLSSKCENSDSSISKEHLLFSFIPSKHFIQLSSWLVCIPVIILYTPKKKNENVIPGNDIKKKSSSVKHLPGRFGRMRIVVRFTRYYVGV